MHIITESIYRRAVNNYYSVVIGTPVEASTPPQPALHTLETARRLICEEGYGGAWPLFLMKQDEHWWVSAAPGLLSHALNIVQPARSAGRFDGALATALREIVARQHTVQYAGHSLLFIPAVDTPASASDTLPDSAVIRPITPQEKPSNVPDESVQAGTAFGVFIGNALVSWAEATPLSTVTPRFGVMLVGIETAGVIASVAMRVQP